MMISYWGFRGRMDAIIHKILHPLHDIKWRTDADDVCDGDIICETCDYIFWCRVYDLSQEELKKRLKIEDD